MKTQFIYNKKVIAESSPRERMFPYSPFQILYLANDYYIIDTIQIRNLNRKIKVTLIPKE